MSLDDKIDLITQHCMLPFIKVYNKLNDIEYIGNISIKVNKEVERVVYEIEINGHANRRNYKVSFSYDIFDNNNKVTKNPFEGVGDEILGMFKKETLKKIGYKIC